jgi:hypothetical protein
MAIIPIELGAVHISKLKCRSLCSDWFRLEFLALSFLTIVKGQGSICGWCFHELGYEILRRVKESEACLGNPHVQVGKMIHATKHAEIKRWPIGSLMESE